AAPLMRSTMAASVVVLPLLLGPTTSVSPVLASASCRTAGGRCSSSTPWTVSGMTFNTTPGPPTWLEMVQRNRPAPGTVVEKTDRGSECPLQFLRYGPGRDGGGNRLQLLDVKRRRLDVGDQPADPELRRTLGLEMNRRRPLVDSELEQGLEVHRLHPPRRGD